MELHHIEKQLILYTKNHFKDENGNSKISYDEDLKYFAGRLYGLSVEHVEPYSILHMVTDLHQKLVKNDYLTFDLEDFLFDSLKRTWRDGGQEGTITFSNIIKQMLAEIQCMEVYFGEGHEDNLELGEADLSIIEKEV